MQHSDVPCRHPQLSVVVPTFNGAVHLGAQLEAISRQECAVDWEVIIADNGSTDATVAVASSFRDSIPQLRITEVGEKGKAHALNAGVAAASGSLIVCLDHDDVVAPGYLEAMRRALASDHLAGGRLEYALLNPSWAIVAAPQTTSLTLGGAHVFSLGAALAFRRVVHEKLSGFATDVGPGDDLDFCWRAQVANFTLVFVPDAVVHYRHRIGLRQQFHRGMEFGRARALLQRKYGADAAPLVSGLSRLRAVASHAVHAKDPLRRYQLADLAGWYVGFQTVDTGLFGVPQRRAVRSTTRGR